MKTFPRLLVAALAIGLFACGGDDGTGTPDTSTNDVATTDVAPTDTANNETPAADTPTTETPAATVSFAATLVDFASKAPKAGVDMILLNDETGAPLDAVKYPAFKSGTNGVVDLQLPPDIEVGFKAWGASGAMKFKDSYQFHYASNSHGRRIYAASVFTYQGAISMAAIKEVDKATLGHLAGTIYYRDADGNEEFIGCVTIEVLDSTGKKIEEVSDKGYGTYAAVRYFDTTTDSPTSIAVSAMTHGLNSRYMVGDLPSGKYTIVAHGTWAPTEELGRVDLHAFPDSISIGNIYIDHSATITANPTPATDECHGKAGQQ